MESEHISPERFEKWAEIFKVMGHPIRFAILFAIFGSDYVSRKEGRCLRFSEIKAILRIQSNEELSYHLGVLKKAGLIAKEPYENEYFVYKVTEKGTKFLQDFGVFEYIKGNVLSYA